MFFNQGGACAENCGECQEQACRRRTIALGDGTRKSGNQPAKSEANGMLVPLALVECRPFEADNHLTIQQYVAKAKGDGEPGNGRHRGRRERRRPKPDQ